MHMYAQVSPAERIALQVIPALLVLTTVQRLILSSLSRHSNGIAAPAKAIVFSEVPWLVTSIQWRGNFHWTLCVSTLIQSGVDIASDGLTPLLNRGVSTAFSVVETFQRIFWTSLPHHWKHSIPSE